MISPAAYFQENFCKFFVGYDVDDKEKFHDATSFIRLHREKLKEKGDISVPSDLAIWVNNFTSLGLNLDPDAIGFFEEADGDQSKISKKRFLEVAAKWLYPVERVEMCGQRYALYLNREATTRRLFQLLLPEDGQSVRFGRLEKNPQRCVYVCEMPEMYTDTTDMSFYRAKLVKEIMDKVLHCSQWVIESDGCQNSDILHVEVISNAMQGRNCNETHLKKAVIKIGIVTESRSKKQTKIPFQDYTNVRANDMCLMALHKYGIRDKRVPSLISRLAPAAVTVDLLETKPSSPVPLTSNGRGSTKGAAFILYNSARIESLLRSFNEHVACEDYKPLPKLEEIDLSLLKEDEEWQMVFGYVLALPNLIERCVEHLEKGIFSGHLIVHFLSGFVSVFSVYYRRVRILTQTRPHLMPVVYARIYLIQAARKTLNEVLSLLDIEPVAIM